MRTRRLAAVALSLLLVGACSKSDKKTSATTAPTSTSTSTSLATTSTTAVASAPKITLATLELKSHTEPYDYTVAYPQLAGHGGANATIKALAQTAVDDFLTEAKKQAAEPDSPSGRSNLTGTSTTTLVTARVASFRFELQTFYAGAAHPTTEIKVFTVDLADDQEVTLARLFKPGSAYLNYLSSHALEQLHATFSDGVTDDGAAPKAENFAAFNLGATDLEVTFQQYQVGPGAFGTPRVVFRYVDLAPFAAAGGFLVAR